MECDTLNLTKTVLDVEYMGASAGVAQEKSLHSSFFFFEIGLVLRLPSAVLALFLSRKGFSGPFPSYTLKSLSLTHDQGRVE